MSTQDRNDSTRLFLIGPRGCGKTSIGIMLARQLGAGFWDTDLVLGEMLGESIASFVAREGWDRFRDVEHKALCTAIEAGEDVTPGPDGRRYAVVSTGGGIVLRAENRALLQEKGQTIYLEVPAPVLARRLERNPGSAQRPSLTGKGILDEIADVLAAREALYRGSARYVLDADRRPEDICATIVNLVRGAGQ